MAVLLATATRPAAMVAHLAATAARPAATATRLAAMVAQLAAMVVRPEAMAVRLAAMAVHLAAMAVHLAATVIRPRATVVRLAAMAVHLAATVIRPRATVVRLAAMVARPGALVVHRAVWGRQEATADLTALDHQAWVVVWATIALAVWVALTATRPVVWAVQAWDLEWVPTAMVAHLTVWEAVRVATAATAVDTKYACCFKSCPIAHTTPFLFSCDLTGLFYKFVELPGTSQRVRPMKLTEDV